MTTPSYPNGRGPATESALASADRMLASIAEVEAAHAAKIRSMLAPTKPEQLPPIGALPMSLES